MENATSKTVSHPLLNNKLIIQWTMNEAKAL